MLLVALAPEAEAQSGYSAFGRRFVVAFPDTTQSHTRVLYNTLETHANLKLVSLDTARVTISSPGYLRSVTVVPERSTTIVLTDPAFRASKIFVDSVGRPQPWTFDVRSDRPVAVTAYFATIHGAEAFTPLPVEQWGREYFAATLNQSPFLYNALGVEETNTWIMAPSALMVVASEDNTEVTIESRTLVVGPPTRTVTLNSGQAYVVETAVPGQLDSLTTPDLSGTRITATKPIGVISGNTRTLGSGDNPQPLSPLPTNAMSNSAYEWLHPTSSHGHTFIYRQFSAVDERNSSELVRVYATAPGLTTVSLTHGPPMGILQGEFLEFSSRKWRIADSVLQPFGIRTDKPAQAFVVTASSALLIGSDPERGVELETMTWSPAMAELVPRERWITIGRYGTPTYPGGIYDYVIIAADSGATVLLDGQPVTLDSTPVIGTTYRHARIPVTPGDHTLRSTDGRFTATAFGQRRGYAAYRPWIANPGDEPREGAAAHPTDYLELLSIAYAMPVPGFSDITPPSDSLGISRLDRCDSTVFTANRLNVTWSSSIVEATLDAGSRNTDVAITKTFNNKLHVGFRIRFMPVDPAQDAEAIVIVRNDAGQAWSIPWSYRAHTVALAPSSVELLAVEAGETRTIPLTLTNQKPFTTTVIDVRLLNGSQGFTLLEREKLPKPLASGGSFSMTLQFTGAEPGTLYRDTLRIVSVCDTMDLPISARTAPPAPAPLPLITGYDWGLRRVGSVNDTLSFISNAGTLPFTVARIEIVDDPSRAFSTVGAIGDPDVEPAGRDSIGVRFTPPAEGTFIARILLVTTDGDSADAELIGRALLARIDVDDLGVPALCAGRALDTFVTLRATGSLASRVDSIVVTAPANVRVELDTAWLGLPVMIEPGDSLRIRLRLVGLAPGALDVAVVVNAAAIGDSLARIVGEVITCAALDITATDHDFGAVLLTRSRAGTVELINTGEGDVRVQSMRIVDDAEGAFRIDGPQFPFDVPRGASVTVDATFTPPTLGPKSARIEYETTTGIVHSHLVGIGERVIIPARIPRYYRGEPGRERRVVVLLERAADVAGVASIDVTVDYAPDLLDFVALHDTAAAQVGLRLVSAVPGRVRFELLPRGDSLLVGAIAALRFVVRIALADSSELPLAIEDSIPWIDFETGPGLFVRDPWCGLAERMFEFTSGELTLRPVAPNPVRGDATIELAVPFDGETSLVIVDALGTERLRLVDGHLGAGWYAASIPAGTLTAGVYFARLSIGEMQRVVRFVVE